MFGNQGQEGFGRGNGNRRRGEGNDNNNRPLRNYHRNRRSQTNGPRDHSQDSNNGQNSHHQQQQGNRRGRGNSANRNMHNDHQPRSTGQGNRAPNDNFYPRDHRENSNSGQNQQKQQGNSSEQKKKFEGPVFGFTRLFNFLTADANEVISNMSRNLQEWEILLEQDSIATMKTLRNGHQEMSDDLLVLIVTLLAEKVLSDTIVLESKQIALISSSASSRNFLSKIDSKCRTYMMQDCDVVSNRKKYNGNGAPQNE